MSWYEIEKLRVKAGLIPTDTSKDTELESAADVALSIAEGYCDRYFLKATQEETFVHILNRSVLLKRYPVESITTFDPKFRYHIDMPVGAILFDGNVFEHELKITYEGGYDPVPDDLELALMMIFEKVYSSSIAPMSSGDSVKSAKIGDLSITYGAGEGSSFIPIESIYLLENYRRLTA